MGSGKSTIGRKLAKALGCNFVDLDRYIESWMGASISDIFRYEGEEKFREYESEALTKICEEQTSCVISAGGGTPCYHGNMDVMNSKGLTIYLKHSAKQLASRLAESHTKRPLIAGMNYDEIVAFTETKLAEREEFYNKAQLITQHTSRDVTELVRTVKNYIK